MVPPLIPHVGAATMIGKVPLLTKLGGMSGIAEPLAALGMAGLSGRSAKKQKKEEKKKLEEAQRIEIMNSLAQSLNSLAQMFSAGNQARHTALTNAFNQGPIMR